jgi:hypothetical protein
MKRDTICAGMKLRLFTLKLLTPRKNKEVANISLAVHSIIHPSLDFSHIWNPAEGVRNM